MYKKIKETIFLPLVLAVSLLLTGCTNASAAYPEQDRERLSIVCTIFPAYDWVLNIMGDRAENADIIYLLGSGADLHNYQPTAEDFIRISSCDLLVYAGGESDEWIDDAAESAVNRYIKKADMLDIIGENAKTEEHKEGMQEEDHGEEKEEYDEHVWLSLKNAKIICEGITNYLCEIDPDGSDTYKSNLAYYCERLDSLDADFRSLIGAAKIKTLIFGDRFPFRYFTDDYGLDYYAAFSGCSAESEANFDTIIFLAEKMNELGSKCIYTIERSDKSVAYTIINNTKAKDQSVAELNSIQSVSNDQIERGADYISLMRGNYEVLKENLL